MHRGFFARAIGDSPKDPLGSPYGSSVLAAYRSAGSLIALVRDLDAQLPQPTERLWFLWTHLFSCAVVLGSIVTRCPTMSLANSALVQLDSACELFARVAGTFRAGKVLNIMQNLQQKAHIALQEFKEGRLSGSPLLQLPLVGFQGPASPETPDDDDDELAKLGGKTRWIRVVRDKGPDGQPIYVKESSASPALSPLRGPGGYSAFGMYGNGNGNVGQQQPMNNNPVVPLPLTLPLTGPGTSGGAGVHPSVVEYLNSFGFAGQTGQAHGHSRHTSQQQMAYDSYAQGRSGYESSGSSSKGTGAGALPTPTSPDTALVLPSPAHAHQAHASHSQSHPHPHSHSQGQQQQYFPQYFPVFDYSASSTSGNGAVGNAYVQAYEQDATMAYEPELSAHARHGHGGHAGMNGAGLTNGVNGAMNGTFGAVRRDITPEASMHSTWMDFVHQMSGV